VEVRDVPDPKILNQRDCIVKITSTAICGSDLHLYNGFMPTMEQGDVLGHEFMGEVVEVGRAVKHLKVGDRVVVPFTISCGVCNACKAEMYSCCENSNPIPHVSEKLTGHHLCGFFGYSRLTGGFAGGQAEYARVPFADVGPLKIENGFTDEQVLFLSDIFPTGYFAADMADIEPGDVVAVWGAGPVGLFAMASAKLMGAERVIAIDRFDYRLKRATERAGATDVINYEQLDGITVVEALRELTGGRGPDRCIDAVGMEAHAPGLAYAYDRAKQALKLETDRPFAIREAIMACKSGGTVSIVGVYGGFDDKFPLGSLMNRAVSIKCGQTHVQRYMKPLLGLIERGEIDPTMVISHTLPLADAPKGYDLFVNKKDDCQKVVLKA
jgi:threonine dehydrogenase-like Zn-dependent dehydrogenase